MRLRLVAALLVFGVVFLFHQTAHAASCVPVLAGQEESFGNPYWQSGYYLNDLMHPHPHETYPEVELTWNPHDASDLVGYKVVAEDAYTTDGSLSQSIATLAKMPLTVTVGKDTRQVRLPNMASQLRTWVVYARFDGGALSDDPIASTTLICGQDVRENRSNDAPYVYVDLVNTDGMTQKPEAIGYSDWTDYGCHYALPDEYARGVDPNSIYGQPAHYPFTGSWNWGSPVVGELVDDSYDVEGLSSLRGECLSDKPTEHLAEAWDIEPIRFISETGDGQVSEPPTKPTGLSATASHDSVTLTWNDPGDDTITGYVILRRSRKNGINSAAWSELEADTGSAATTYTDATVRANISYAYRIKAINEYGVSGVSKRSRWVDIDTP